MTENLGSAGVSINDLVKVTIPAFGQEDFTLQTLEGKELVPELVGIIVYAPQQKGLWSQSYEEAPGAAPCCFSKDARVGQGDRDGVGVQGYFNCIICPKNRFGTGKNGGKECIDLRPIYLVMEGKFLPINIKTPVMSLQPFQKYLTMLSNCGLPYYGVVTKITATPNTKAGKTPHNILAFAVVDKIPKELRDTIKAYQHIFSEHAAASPVDEVKVAMSDIGEPADWGYSPSVNGAPPVVEKIPFDFGPASDYDPFDGDDAEQYTADGDTSNL